MCYSRKVIQSGVHYELEELWVSTFLKKLAMLVPGDKLREDARALQSCYFEFEDKQSLHSKPNILAMFSFERVI